MSILVFILIWLAGSVLALLGNRKIREYKDYSNPRFILICGIVLCVVMSWVMVYLLIEEDGFKLPDRIYHNCYESYDVSWEEEYLDEDGNKVGPEDKWKVHHTYRVYTCSKCGKVEKEQLQ